MATRAALGCKLHTGWAMLVALAGQPGAIEVLFRGRIELLPLDESIPRFIYHEAAEMSLARAAEFVKRAREASQKAARPAIKDVLRELDSRGARAKVCGVLLGSTQVPGDLSRILGSHPLIHAAEGALFQQAIVSACENCGLSVKAVREREVWSQAAEAWALAEPELRKEVDAARTIVGAPWNADHKSAAAIALLALR